jgi:hypothetical protein
MHDIEHHHPDVMLKPHNDDLERIYNVLEQYDDLMEDELMAGDVFGSAAQIMDEKLYSNGVDDFQILPTGQTGYHSKLSDAPPFCISLLDLDTNTVDPAMCVAINQVRRS